MKLLLVVMTTLVGNYEVEPYPIDTPERHRLVRVAVPPGAKRMTASDPGNLLGNRSLGSKFLRGERELSKTHLRIPAEHFKVDAGLFL